MVLRLKTWESRSPPGLLNAGHADCIRSNNLTNLKTGFANNAGWSSPVARQAHNLKVVGSNPTPATKLTNPNTQSKQNTPFLPGRGVLLAPQPSGAVP